MARAAGKAFRQPALIFGDLDDIENTVGFFLHLIARDLAQFQAVFDVFAYGEMREDGIALKDHADITPMRRQIVDALVIKSDLAAFYAVEAGDHAQQRRLAAAGWPEQGEKFSIVYFFRQTGDDGQIAVALDYVVDMDGNTHIRHLLFCIDVSLLLL